MKQRIKAFFAGGILALALFGPVVAGPFKDGQVAYSRGDYATAMSLWRPLAEQGDAPAQTALAGCTSRATACGRTMRRPSSGSAGALARETQTRRTT
jgi:hypothetical protein